MKNVSKTKSVVAPKSKGPSVVMVGSLIFSVLLLIFVVMYMGTSKDTRNLAVNDNDCPGGYHASKNAKGNRICVRDETKNIEKCTKFDRNTNECLEYKPTAIPKCNPLTEKQVGYGASMTCVKLNLPTKTQQVTCKAPLYPAKNQKGNTVCMRKGRKLGDGSSLDCWPNIPPQTTTAECITDEGLAGHQTCELVGRNAGKLIGMWMGCQANKN